MVLLVEFWLAIALLIAVAYLGYFVWKTHRIAAWARSQVPVAGKFVEVDGQRIHYVEAGQGPPLLFVHGLAGQLHHFKGTIFDQLKDRYRLVALDRPGSGYSTRPMTAAAGLSAQAATIVKFMQATGIERPLLVGHSLGGAIALTLAVEHPQAIRGLVLISPLTHDTGHIPPAFASLNIHSRWLRRFLCETFAVPTSLRMAPQTLSFVFGPQPAPPDYPTRGGGLVGLTPSHIYAAGADFVDAQADLGRIERRYGEIDMPVAVMFGTADNLLDWRQHGEAMRDKIKGADVEIVDGLGHMPQFIMPQRVAALIERVAARVFEPV